MKSSVRNRVLRPRQGVYLSLKLGVAGGKNKRNGKAATPQGE
jgi:hypothetical protein